jgi:hypothetical protein
MSPDPNLDQMWVAVAPDETRASIEAAIQDVDCEPALVSFAWGSDRTDGRAVLVKAGTLLLWAFDPYDGARLDAALYGSEVGCRLGDD